MVRVDVRASLLVCLLSLTAACAGGGAAGDDDDDGASPTPTLSENAIGCRDVTISSGKDGTGDGRSVFYTTAIGGDLSEFLDAGGWVTRDPLRLCAGEPVANEAPVTLASDVTVAISLPQGNCLCRQYVAAGTSGSLYCGASSDLLDFRSSMDSNATSAGAAATMTEEAGTVIGEGALKVRFMARGLPLESGSCTVEACETALSGQTPREIFYTSGKATSEVTDSRQGGTVGVNVTGTAFDATPDDGVADCEEWTSGTVGALAGGPAQEEDHPQLSGDVATVERIAE